MQPLPPSGERSNWEIQLDSQKRLEVSTWRWKLGAQVAHGSFGFADFAPWRIRRIICYEVVWHEFAASQPVLPDAQRMADWSQAALQRQQRVASYQYVPTSFPAHQNVHVNKRLLACPHVMMSNEHKKHSLDTPWTGPYTIDWKGKVYTVSIDRLRSAYMLSDFNQSCHDVSRSASANNHIRLSAAQISNVSPSFSPPSDAIRHSPPLTSSPCQPRHTRTRVVRRPDGP